MQRMTMGEAADRLAEVDGYLPPDYFARQLRGFAQRGLLGHLEYRGHGRTAAALLGERELCLGRLLSALSRAGVHPDQLHGATRLLNNVHSRHPVGEKPAWHRAGFRGVVESVGAGERWFFVLKIGPWPRGADPAVGDVGGGFYQGLADLELPDLAWIASVVLDCAYLFGPLLRPSDPA